MFHKLLIMLEGFGVGFEIVSYASTLDQELVMGLALLLAVAIVLITLVHATPNPSPPRRSRGDRLRYASFCLLSEAEV